jgi:hypothetical protein
VSGRRTLITFAAILALATIVSGQRSSGGPAGASPAVVFTEVARAAGIDVRHVNGASPDKHLVETMGSGAVLFDFDNDNWLDIFIVDGGSLADAAVAKTARHRLRRQ